ncbi:unnamed protein product, partial [Lymnaea stagnalis]
MSALHNGLISEDMVKNVFDALKENTILSRQGKMEKFSNKKEQDSDHLSTAVNDANHLDPNRERCDTLPNLILPPKKDLRYSDDGPVVNEHDLPKESSHSGHTLEGGSKGEIIDINSTFGGENRVESSPSGHGLGENVAVTPEFTNAQRPESLSLPKPIQTIEQEQNKLHSINKNHTGDNFLDGNNLPQNVSQPIDIPEEGAHFIDESNSLSSSLPHGTIMRKGDMIQFVADDLQEKIKQSSPLSFVADTVSTNSRRSSVRSIASFSSSTSFATSSGVSRSPSSQFQQSPDDIPPIDATAVIELENHARRVADNLDLMMGNIRNNLHKMSAITIGCQDAYKRSVDITCDSVDASIKSMYALMAKCEELSASMGPVEQLATQMYPFISLFHIPLSYPSFISLFHI